MITGLPQFAPKAKRIIYLFQNGAPSQLDLFDYKPKLQEMFGQDLPASIRMGQRLTGMTADQKKFPLVLEFGGFVNLRHHGAPRAAKSLRMSLAATTSPLTARATSIRKLS